MRSQSRSGPAHLRGLQLVPCETPSPGSQALASHVPLPGTALPDRPIRRERGPRGPRHALPLPLFVEPRGTHQRVTLRDHIAAGPSAGHNQLDAEINMVEICTNLPLDVEMTGTAACSDTEHFSGYIITTGRSK